MAERSKADEELLASTLQPQVTAARVTENLGTLRKNILELIGRRDALKAVNTLPNVDRKSGAFPVAYLQLLAIPTSDGALDEAHETKNRAIIEIVRSIVNGFPHSPDDANKKVPVEQMRDYKPDRFTYVESDGTFVFRG